VLSLPDGGEVALDWRVDERDLDDEGREQDDPEAQMLRDKSYEGPIVLFLPGLTGHSQSEYIKSLINVAHDVSTVGTLNKRLRKSNKTRNSTLFFARRFLHAQIVGTRCKERTRNKERICVSNYEFRL